MKSKESQIAVTVAIIGLLGVLGAAIINNWDKLFPSNPTAVPPNEPVASCGGTEVGGRCWYFGQENASCDTVCAARGGYDAATRTYAGSDGSASNCQNILRALNIPLDDFFETAQGGLGCFAIQNTSGNYSGYWDTQTTTAAATYQTPGRRRICACQR